MESHLFLQLTQSHSDVQKRPALRQLQYSFKHLVLVHVQCTAAAAGVKESLGLEVEAHHVNGDGAGLMMTDWIK